METIHLKVTEHPGRKSGRFTYQAIKDGQVLYTTTTDRTYYAITLVHGKTGFMALNRYGRLDLWMKAKIGEMVAVVYVAKTDFVDESVDRVKVMMMVQEYLDDLNCRPADWGQSDMTPAEHREFVLEANKALDLMKDPTDLPVKPEMTAEDYTRVEETLERLGRAGKIADQIMDLMDAHGFTTWEEMEPMITTVLDIKLRTRAKAANSEHSIPESHV